jgi:hypothetical protein
MYAAMWVAASGLVLTLGAGRLPVWALLLIVVALGPVFFWLDWRSNESLRKGLKAWWGSRPSARQ